MQNIFLGIIAPNITAMQYYVGGGNSQKNAEA